MRSFSKLGSRTATQRFLSFWSAGGTAGFSQIAVIPSTTAVDTQWLVSDEQKTSGSRQTEETLTVRYHGTDNGASLLGGN